MDRKTLRTVRNILSNLYPDIDESQLIAGDVELSIGRISFSSKAVLNWNEILNEAEKVNKTNELIERVFEDYPGQEVLKEVLKNGSVKPSAAPVVDEDLPWLSTTPADQIEKLWRDENNLLPISFFEGALKCSRPVARIRIENLDKVLAIATGFLVRDNLFITPNHVLADRETAEQAVIQFNYQRTLSGDAATPSEYKLDPETGFMTSKEDDWTVVKVKGDANIEFGQIDLVPFTDHDSFKYVNVIQHPRGDMKKIAMYRNIVAYSDDKRVQYLADTLEGSSGAPVFDNNWRIVAMHHSGGYSIEPETNKPVFRKEGININLIVKALEQNPDLG